MTPMAQVKIRKKVEEGGDDSGYIYSTVDEVSLRVWKGRDWEVVPDEPKQTVGNADAGTDQAALASSPASGTGNASSPESATPATPATPPAKAADAKAAARP